jgi:hypothetical protein
MPRKHFRDDGTAVWSVTDEEVHRFFAPQPPKGPPPNTNVPKNTKVPVTVFSSTNPSFKKQGGIRSEKYARQEPNPPVYKEKMTVFKSSPYSSSSSSSTD